MDRGTIQILFALLRSAICGTKPAKEELTNYSSEMLQDLLKISSKHDVTHLLVLGLKRNDLIIKDNNDIEKYIIKAVCRYEKIRYEYENICQALEKAQIPFIPLKGSVIRKYYPEAWMRTSCDIDILVNESDSEKAKSVLVNEYGYVYNKKGSHDLSFFAPGNTYIELHYNLVEDEFANESSVVLKNVWNMSVVRDGYDFWREMPDEYYYFYHIAHMAKHFEVGGCGIRPFIDLWILDNICNKDQNKRNELLKQGDLLKFSEVSRKLSRVWFDNEEHTEITKQMEQYILSGGVYGTTVNRVAVQQQKKGGRFRYALSRIFIPYDVIKFHYPILQKHRCLTPFMEVRRWFKLIFRGQLKRVSRELKYNCSLSDTEAANMKEFLNNVGL